MKRLLSLVLCFALLLSIPFLSVSAADIVDSGTCGKNLTWTLDSDGVLTISGTGAMYYDSPPWADASVAVKTAVVENGVTRIGDGAFESCTNLENVTLPESVTHIENDAFFDCTGLTYITLPNSVTYIGRAAFYWSGLSSISIPSGVSYIGDMAFGGCNNLTEICVNEKNAKYSDVNGVLFDKEQTELVCCPDGYHGVCYIPADVSNDISIAFDGVKRLTEIHVDENNTKYSSDEQGVLYNKEQTALLRCPEGYSKICVIPESVQSIWPNIAFYDCDKLTGIQVDAENKKFCSDEKGVLYNKSKTVLYVCPTPYQGEYRIPDGVEDIWMFAFKNCSNLTDVLIPSSVKSIGSSAFCACTSLTSTTIPESVMYIHDGAFEDCTGLQNITISEGLARIGRYAFRRCTSLTSITLPESVTHIEDDAFSDCTGLTSVTIPGSVTSMGESAFSGCTHLTSAVVEEGITEISVGLFRDCTALTNVTISSSVDAISAGAFYGCSSLRCALFKGDAPTMSTCVFQMEAHTASLQGSYINIPGLTLYYIEGKEGWTTPTWGENEYPTATWDGVNVPQPPHEHRYTAVVTAPTCAAQGYTTYICTCGESYKDAYTDALGHNYKDGVCTRCGAKDPSYKPDDKPIETIEFSDVSPAAWYAGAVGYAVSNKLMNGMGGGKFEPNGSMTRAMLVTVLWRYAGSPAEGTNGFSDVPNGDWYTQAVAWASKNGVVNGVGNGRFDPNGKITREQMAVILFRYANQQGINTGKRGDFGKFADANKVSGYAVDALQWAVAEGIVGGSSEGGKLLLNPQGNATRAEVATILMRFLENVMK